MRSMEVNDNIHDNENVPVVEESTTALRKNRSPMKKRMSSFAGVSRRFRRSSTKVTSSGIGSIDHGGTGSGYEASSPTSSSTRPSSPLLLSPSVLKRKLRVGRQSTMPTEDIRDMEDSGRGGGIDCHSDSDMPTATSTIHTAILTSYDHNGNNNDKSNNSNTSTISPSGGPSGELLNYIIDDDDDGIVSQQLAKPGLMCGIGSGGNRLLQNIICGGNSSKYNPEFSDDDEEQHKNKVEKREDDGDDETSDSSNSNDSLSKLPNDPTIQESIECIFAHQFEEHHNIDLCSGGDDGPDDDDDDDMGLNDYTKQLGKLCHVGKFDPFLDIRDPPLLREYNRNGIDNKKQLPSSICDDTASCRCRCGLRSPAVSPDLWPQRPLMLRPTPGCGIRVIGVRFASSNANEYLWKHSTPNSDKDMDSSNGCNSNDGWPKRLNENWKKGSNNSETSNCNNNLTFSNMCPECVLLPINNGNEPEGQSLVVDFVSDLFIGTLLVRIRHSNGTTEKPYDDSFGYFAGMNRRYQVVIQGKFRKPIPLTKCVTGQVLERPCGKLPPNWILKGGEKVIKFFAPQLETHLESDRPSTLSPLGSTPQVIKVQKEPKTPRNSNDGDSNNDISQLYNADVSIEKMQEEPKVPDETLLNEASDAPESLARARHRKKLFDKLYVAKSLEPVIGPTSLSPEDEEVNGDDKIYTFEFLQHMINFNEFTVELGSFLGSLPLQPTLDGQPLQIMAQYDENHHDNNAASSENADSKKKKKKGSNSICKGPKQVLWSFDIWHESLYDDAVKYDNGKCIT